jgi:hypothetical protein
MGVLFLGALRKASRRNSVAKSLRQSSAPIPALVYRYIRRPFRVASRSLDIVRYWLSQRALALS